MILLKCEVCNIEFNRSKTEVNRSKTKRFFCSRRCSTTFNNKIPKRKRVHRECPVCQKSLRNNAKYCQSHRRPYKLSDTTTISELTQSAKYQKSAYLRNHARRVYKRSGKPLACFVCDYSNHIEVCHIKPIASFPDTATLGEVNCIDNLVALCPNHHWELDNKLITL